MSRSRFRLAAAILSVFALTCVFHDADAAKKKKKGKASKPAATAAFKGDAKALGELMGPYKFGMTQKDVLGILYKQIGEKYKEKISATNDVYAQDKLRRKQKEEFDRIKKSFTKFEGKKTGWDVSIIDDQFAHNTDESMMVHWENAATGAAGDQRRFFFFYDGRLYKMLIALNSSQLKNEQRTFDYFRGLMEARYGKGSVKMQKDVDNVERPTGIEWRSKSHHVSALDKLAFYGSFVLVVAEPGQEQTLASVRSNSPKKPKSSTMQTVLIKDGEDDTPSLDENKAGSDAVLRGGN
jgi:hypothetical protein